MSQSWWVIVRTPAGRHLVDFGQRPPGEPEMVALRAEFGVPTDWLDRRGDLGEDWWVSLSQGEPHPELLWSPAELAAARETLEDAAGVPAKRAKLKELRDTLTATGDALPDSVLQGMLATVRDLDQGVRAVGLEDVRVKLARDTPPSQSTVHRKPKPPKDG